MPAATKITVVNVGYRSTNFWVVSAGTSRLLVDLGYPNTLGTMRANLDRMGVPLKEIRYSVATHYHYDHAGLAQDFKKLGVPLIVLAVQVAAIPLMKPYMKPTDHYTEITTDGNVAIDFAESRHLLDGIGIAGEIVPTPGHSDDSVSLVLDDGSAFIGDLTPPRLITDAEAAVTKASWRLLQTHGVTRIYPGHGPIHTMDWSALD